MMKFSEWLEKRDPAFMEGGMLHHAGNWMKYQLGKSMFGMNNATDGMVSYDKSRRVRRMNFYKNYNYKAMPFPSNLDKVSLVDLLTGHHYPSSEMRYEDDWKPVARKQVQFNLEAGDREEAMKWQQFINFMDNSNKEKHQFHRYEKKHPGHGSDWSFHSNN